jgi:hypothetical protein
MKRVDGGANVEGDASIGVGQSNGHEDEGKRGSEPPAVAIGVATEKVGQMSSDMEMGTLSRDRRRRDFLLLRKLAQGLGCRSSRKGARRYGTASVLFGIRPHLK